MGALQHGTNAAGAARLRPGACWTPEDDLLYALGFPHLFLVSDDEPDDPEAAARRFLQYEPAERSVPRSVLPRVLRAIDVGFKKRKSPEADAAFASDEDVDPDAAEAMFLQFLRKRFTDRRLPLLAPHLFETVLGPERLLEIWIGEMEHDPSHWLQDYTPIRYLVMQLGYPLLRVPPEAAKAFHSRSRALLEEHAETIGLESGSRGRKALRTLDVVLNGREGAERSGYWLEGFLVPRDLSFIHDDPDFVFEQASGLPMDASSRPEARIAWLVGERWLEEEARRWRRYRQPTPGNAHAAVVDRLGRFRSDTVLAMMLDMASGSKAKRAVTTWFVDHAEHARPFLEAAVGGERDLTARKLLKKVR